MISLSCSTTNTLLPIGAIGEICIGGKGLSRGYVNLKALTNDKFIIDPFTVNGKDRLYKTGDYGRWQPDGNIDYIGRIDEQVKINGYRIELLEIESVLLQSHLVKQAVLLSRKVNSGNNTLVAYVVPNGSFSQELLDVYLRER